MKKHKQIEELQNKLGDNFQTWWGSTKVKDAYILLTTPDYDFGMSQHKDCINDLNDIEKQVLKLRYGLEIDDRPDISPPQNPLWLELISLPGYCNPKKQDEEYFRKVKELKIKMFGGEVEEQIIQPELFD